MTFWVGFACGVGFIVLSFLFCIGLVNSPPWRAMQDAYPEADPDDRLEDRP